MNSKIEGLNFHCIGENLYQNNHVINVFVELSGYAIYWLIKSRFVTIVTESLGGISRKAH